jgi:uncharacterized protein YoxC
MTAWLTAFGAWLQQVPGSLPDTIVTKAVTEDPGWWGRVTSVADGIMTLTLIALAIALIPAAWNFRNSYKKVNTLLDKVYGDINPIMRHASTIADNVNYITTSVRVDVQQVNQTIAEANQRLQEAVALTERRIREFDALLQVVQQEAEGAFIASAATLRGVRAGAAAFRDGAAELLRGATDAGDVEDVEGEEWFAGAEAPEADVENIIEADEVTHGDHDHPDAPADDRPRPRIRPRSGRARPA